MAKKIEYKGILLVNTVKIMRTVGTMHSGNTILGDFNHMLNGREELLLKLKKVALEAGANAVVGLTMETNIISGNVLDVVALGTAIYFER